MASPTIALPVFPGAEGFGSTSAYAYEQGGRGVTSPTVYKVTNLDNAGTGSLRAAMEANGPRIVIFEVGGDIVLNNSIDIDNDYLMVAGETAPSPGIAIIGGGRVIVENVDNVFISHIRIRPNIPRSTSPTDGVGFGVGGGNDQNNLYFDHLTITWASDEGISGYAPAAGGSITNVTLRHLLVSETDSVHPRGSTLKSHYEGIKNISYIGNLFSNFDERGPVMNTGTEIVLVNELRYNFEGYYMHMTDNIDETFESRVNVYGSEGIPGPIGGKTYLLKILDSVNPNSTLYINDLLCTGGTDADCVDDSEGIGLEGSPTMTLYSPMTVQDSADVEAWVLARAGARPADRDSIDTCLIAQVTSPYNTPTGFVSLPAQNDTDSCGYGWTPNTTGTTRSLTVPGNPHVVAASGYTNLEEWLHGYRAAVEEGVTVKGGTNIFGTFGTFGGF